MVHVPITMSSMGIWAVCDVVGGGTCHSSLWSETVASVVIAVGMESGSIRHFIITLRSHEHISEGCETV